MVTYYGFGDTARLQGLDGSIPRSCNSFSVSSASTLVRTSRIVLDEHPVRQIVCMSHLDYGFLKLASGTKDWNVEKATHMPRFTVSDEGHVSWNREGSEYSRNQEARTNT
jgi:hypothetical protein